MLAPLPLLIMPRRTTKICKESECRNEQTTLGYCRLHYLKNWKKIREKQRKKAAENLNKYVEYIMKKHPESYVDAIKHDLRHEERFAKRAEEFSGDEEFSDVMDEMDMGREVARILGNMKVDESF